MFAAKKRSLFILPILLFVGIPHASAAESTQLYATTYFSGGVQYINLTQNSLDILAACVGVSGPPPYAGAYTPPPQSVGAYSPTNWPSSSLANYTQSPATGFDNLWFNGSYPIQGSSMTWPFAMYGSSPSNGQTYIFFWQQDTSTPSNSIPCGYLDLYYDSSGSYTPPEPPTDLSTRIVPILPLDPTGVSTTTSSTTVSFSAKYFYASTTPATTGFYYDQISLRLNRLDAASTSEYNFSVATDTETTINNTITFPANSAWSYFWGFSGLAPWGRIDGTYSTNQGLYILANPLPLYFGTSTENLTGLATSTCSVINISGCFQNAVVFLFWPQDSTFNQFKVLQGNIRVHAPFGYIFYMIDSIESLNTTASSSFSLDIPSEIQDSFFTPLRTAIGLILFALTGFWFFKRVRDLHI